MKETLLYEGKAKCLYSTSDPDLYVMEYKDDVTAGNGAKKDNIAGKGELNCAICNVIYEMLAQNGVPTHLVKPLDNLNILVRRVEIVPLEVIVRNVAAGSFSKRFGVEEGSPLRMPILEYCLKDDALGDPPLNDMQILALDLATKEELSEIAAQTMRVNELLIPFFAKSGMRLIDFKIEFGRTPDGKILLADEITPDSCRLWDAETGAKLDKDLFRRGLGNILDAYQEVLRRVTL